MLFLIKTSFRYGVHSLSNNTGDLLLYVIVPNDENLHVRIINGLLRFILQKITHLLTMKCY